MADTKTENENPLIEDEYSNDGSAEAVYVSRWNGSVWQPFKTTLYNIRLWMQSFLGEAAFSNSYDDLDDLPDLSAKADLVGGKVPSSQLPAYVDDVLEYADLASFPATGEAGIIYVAINDGADPLNPQRQYRWSGSAYIDFTQGASYTEGDGIDISGGGVVSASDIVSRVLIHSVAQNGTDKYKLIANIGGETALRLNATYELKTLGAIVVDGTDTDLELNVSGTGSHPLLDWQGNALKVSDLAASTVYHIGWDGTNYRLKYPLPGAGAALTLQEVTDNGFKTTNNLIVWDGTDDYASVRRAGGKGLLQVTDLTTYYTQYLPGSIFTDDVGTGFSSTLQHQSITDDRAQFLPDADGTLVMTVNGIAADANGNVVIATGGGTLDTVPTNGSTNGVESNGVFDADAAVYAAAQAYADGLVVGLWDDRGNHDASGGAYPSTGGSGTAGAILKGDIWTISVAGTLPTGQAVAVGDTVRAKIDTPGNTQANWAIQENNIGYAPLNPTLNLSDLASAATARTNLGFTNALVKRSSASLATVSTTTASIPADDTIPQNTEGTEILTVSHTPLNTANKLVISVVVYWSISVAGGGVISLFQDSVADALSTVVQTSSTAGHRHAMVLRHEMTAGTTSAITFKIRIGTSTGTLTVNGAGGTRLFGGTVQSSIHVEEYTP